MKIETIRRELGHLVQLQGLVGDATIRARDAQQALALLDWLESKISRLQARLDARTATTEA